MSEWLLSLDEVLRGHAARVGYTTAGPESDSFVLFLPVADFDGVMLFDVLYSRPAHDFDAQIDDFMVSIGDRSTVERLARAEIRWCPHELQPLVVRAMFPRESGIPELSIDSTPTAGAYGRFGGDAALRDLLMAACDPRDRLTGYERRYSKLDGTPDFDALFRHVPTVEPLLAMLEAFGKTLAIVPLAGGIARTDDPWAEFRSQLPASGQAGASEVPSPSGRTVKHDIAASLSPRLQDIASAVAGVFGASVVIASRERTGALEPSVEFAGTEPTGASIRVFEEGGTARLEIESSLASGRVKPLRMPFDEALGFLQLAGEFGVVVVERRGDFGRYRKWGPWTTEFLNTLGDNDRIRSSWRSWA
ncbi:hypothetical protein [Leifsonia sp. RAF41]|uniref:hypothetical protein n=1 Tax=Leifsonia sp. RAF41 TaxID=3233056 RepID=UPI003F943577